MQIKKIVHNFNDEVQSCSYGGWPTTHNFFPSFFVPGTIFHNRGSIIAQCTSYIHWKLPCHALSCIAPGPPVVGAALRSLHSLRLPLLFTIIFLHSDWAGYNPDEVYICRISKFKKFIQCVQYLVSNLATFSFVQIQWLQCNHPTSENRDKVLDFFRQTHSYRLARIKKERPSIKDVFHHYPCFREMPSLVRLKPKYSFGTLHYSCV